ncbi:MAG: hydrogenase maturation protease [Candidatus Omnitrophica bacterium]|nr:hydrogenase maturation protease [Candidatus Omnitrophota bacterium]
MKNINPSQEPNPELSAEISVRLKGKLAIVGIGNIIRGDDGLGPKLIEILKGRGGLPGASLFDCGTAPENYIFPILSTSCDTLMLVDAADIGKQPGAVAVFDLDKISRVSFSTHNPSPRLFTDLLKTGKEDMNIFVISVQPKSTGIGASLSEEVLRSLENIADIFCAAGTATQQVSL